MIRVGILTAPRPRSTLNQSIKSLREAGCTSRVTVCSDDPSVDYVDDDDYVLVVNKKRLVNFRNWTNCVKLLLKECEADDWICICEDDITWVPQCWSHLEKELQNLKLSSRLRLQGALSLYFPIEMSRDLEKGSKLGPGWHSTSRGIKTWGAQCFVLSKAMAEALMCNRTYNMFLADPKRVKNVDGIIAESLLRDGLRILYRVPCLVDHSLGEGNSSLGYADERPKLKTRYFTGTV